MEAFGSQVSILQMFQISEINLATLPYAVHLLLVLDCSVSFSTGTRVGQMVLHALAYCHLGSSVADLI